MKWLPTLLLVIALPASAQTLDSMVERELPSLLNTYKQFHATPELSMQEKNTSSTLATRLREIGYDVAYPVGKYADSAAPCYGVVAVMKNGPGPTILIRSDMDALPVTEQTGLAYASKVKTKNVTGEEVGVMHACGHDLHMTTLLGTAKILALTKDRWQGTLILIGQPAEEVVKGAAALLNDRLYERFGRPSKVVAFHDSATLEAGKIGYTPGFFMASGDSVNLTIRGVGGHGASPQSTKDPIVLASETILGLQTIISRESSPLDPVVITVGSIHGGTKRNIIPDEVRLLMTVRTYKPEVRKRVLSSIERVARGLAIAAGVPENLAPQFELLEHESIGSTYNDPELTEGLAATLKQGLGDGNVVKMDPLMVSEDVNLYGLDRQIPIAMLSLGAVDPSLMASGSPLPSLHSSRFAPLPEPAIRAGVKGMTLMVWSLMPK
ncbi:MAG TPA: amidohydrolase [Thermoanaerobaculia bacterium]|nr:amidohydrolase [Thermoanaerobaculia bacterium]